MPQREQPLSPKQQRFVEEYLVDLNATAAYRRAGYKARSDNAAAVEGHKLLRNPKIDAAVRAAQANRSQRTGIAADRVLQELARIAFADPRQLYQADGSLKSVKDLDDDTAATVASVEVFEEFQGRGEDREQTGTTRKLKHWNKVEALGKLAQHLGLLDPRKPLQVDITSGGKPLDRNSLTPADIAAAAALVGMAGAGVPPHSGPQPVDPARPAPPAAPAPPPR